jgi:hypothetical protein
MTSTATTTETTPCAGVGNGYFECDIPGGCPDCRRLAIDIDDDLQFDEWADDLRFAGNTKEAAKRTATAKRIRQIEKAW